MKNIPAAGSFPLIQYNRVAILNWRRSFKMCSYTSFQTKTIKLAVGIFKLHFYQLSSEACPDVNCFVFSVNFYSIKTVNT